MSTILNIRSSYQHTNLSKFYDKPNFVFWLYACSILLIILAVNTMLYKRDEMTRIQHIIIDQL